MSIDRDALRRAFGKAPDAPESVIQWALRVQERLDRGEELADVMAELDALEEEERQGAAGEWPYRRLLARGGWGRDVLE